MVVWVDHELPKKVEYRPGDTIISIPTKCGSSWSMNICHQIFTGGDKDFKDIYKEVPWVQFKERPGQPDEELLERWSKLPDPRVFKNNSYPGGGPGSSIEYREDLKYLVVFRNPDEALVSLKLFFETFNMKIWELWGAEKLRQLIVQPDFPTFFEKVVLPGVPGMPVVPPGGLLTMIYLANLNAWWPLRDKPNVLMLHFNDMKTGHEATVRKIAKFLGKELTEEQFAKVFEYTSYRWMKDHQEKFEVQELLPFPMILNNGMIRRGVTGLSRDDGMTPEISATIRSFVDKIVKDPEAREWMYKGGSLQPEVEEPAPRACCNLL